MTTDVLHAIALLVSMIASYQVGRLVGWNDKSSLYYKKYHELIKKLGG